MKKLFFLISFLTLGLGAFPQEDSVWKPQLHITGYVNTMAEYSDLVNGRDVLKKKDPSIGLAEAAFLASYKPLKQLEFKGTFVYTNYIDAIQSLIVEAYGTYTFSEAFKLSAGKYLTPLSPANQFFYAPMNTSATLPMLVSHYALLPQSISGLQVSGKIGEDNQFGYNLTYGSYRIQGGFPGGILGLIGREGANTFNWAYNGAASNYLGGSGRIYAKFGDSFNIGLNHFEGTRSRYSYSLISTNALQYTPARRYATGIDAQFNTGRLKLSGEYWIGGIKTTELADKQIETDFNSYYGECSYEMGIFTPYMRYEHNDDSFSAIYATFPSSELFKLKIPIDAYTIGISCRPLYEILCKLEYRLIETGAEYESINIPSNLQSSFPPDNPLKAKDYRYSHIVLSLVYSF